MDIILDSESVLDTEYDLDSEYALDLENVPATLVVLYLDDLFLFCAVTLNIIEIAILIFYLFLIKKDNLTALASLTLSVND